MIVYVAGVAVSEELLGKYNANETLAIRYVHELMEYR